MKIKSFECPEFIKNNEKKNAWNIKRLVDDSFVPSAHRTSILYSRLTHFMSASSVQWNNQRLCFWFRLGHKFFFSQLKNLSGTKTGWDEKRPKHLCAQLVFLFCFVFQPLNDFYLNIESYFNYSTELSLDFQI